MNSFVYSILQYSHSPLKEERLNVGILFYFIERDVIVFRHPARGFHKWKNLYADFQEVQLINAIRALKEKIHIINSDRGLFREPLGSDSFLDRILVEDSTVLRFSGIKMSDSEVEDVNAICDNYYELYFSDYGAASKKEKRDEVYIIRTFKQKLLSENHDAKNYLQSDAIIEVPKTRVKFDYVWYNGSANLIKPISFDLEDESSINHKAIFHYAQLNFIAEKVNQNNGKINFLVTKPSSQKPSLTRAYANAIDILNDTKTEKEIIDETNFDQYVESVSKKIHAPDTRFPFKNLWESNKISSRFGGLIPPSPPLIE